jgi:PIN domain nuclease of toxin-antitoxin system
MLCGDSVDTHIWVWWMSQPDRLAAHQRQLLERGANQALGVSVISCWEVAKLVEYGRLKLDRPVGLWIERALAEPGVFLLHLDPQIVVESTRLPQPFHRDPADQLLVATARVFDCPFLTEDSKIISYPHVRLA